MLPLPGNTGSPTPGCSRHCAIRSAIPRRAKTQSMPIKPYSQPTRVSPHEQKPRREKRNPCPQQRIRIPTRASHQTAGAEGVTYGNEHEHHTRRSESALLARTDVLNEQQLCGSRSTTRTSTTKCTACKHTQRLQGHWM